MSGRRLSFKTYAFLAMRLFACVRITIVRVACVLEGLTLLKYCMIALGGGLGSIARYWLSTTISNRLGSGFYFGTFLVNVSACLLMGFSLTWIERRTAINPALLYLFPIGFVGAYSTFSTFEWETFLALQMGEFAMGSLYVVSSLLIGLGALWVGVVLARAIV